jgi:hypothetical protein
MITRLIVLLCGLSCAGCSAAFVRRTPELADPTRGFDCTRIPLAPVVDLGLAVQAVLGAAAFEFTDGFAVDGSGSWPPSTDTRVAQGALLAFAGLATWSAAYGFNATAECRRKQESWELQVAPIPPGCTSDAGCKHGRRCELGVCVWPVSARQPKPSDALFDSGDAHSAGPLPPPA